MIGVTRLGYFSKGFMKNFLTKKHFGICLKTSLLNKKTCNWYTLGNFFCPITWSHWSVAWPVTHQGTLECKFKKVWLKIISKKNFFCCVTHLERWISVENTMEGENVTFTIRNILKWSTDGSMTSVTRFGEFSPLYHSIKKLWPFWKGSISICQSFEPTLANFIRYPHCWKWQNIKK